MNFLCILLKVTAIFLSWTNTEIRSQWLSYCLKWRSRRLDSLSSGTYMYKTCLVYRDDNHGSITHCCFMFISFFSFSQFCSVRGFSLNHTLSISFFSSGIWVMEFISSTEDALSPTETQKSLSWSRTITVLHSCSSYS